MCLVIKVLKGYIISVVLLPKVHKKLNLIIRKTSDNLKMENTLQNDLYYLKMLIFSKD